MAIIQDSTGAYTWAIDSGGVASVKITSQVFPTTSSSNLTSAATTNATLVKPSAGSIYNIAVTNCLLHFGGKAHFKPWNIFISANLVEIMLSA